MIGGNPGRGFGAGAGNAPLELVAANLQLTEAEAAKFWPLYNEYRAKHSQIGDRTVALVNDFAANYDALSDEKAKDLLRRQLDIEELGTHAIPS